jgi:diguanylate cyclase (GGDEF)-like protein
MVTHVSGAAEDAALHALAERWLQVVAVAGFVPGRRTRFVLALREMLRELLTAAATEPFDAEPVRRVGARLVELRMADPQVLGASVRLLTDHLPALRDGEAGVARDRMLLVLEQLINGFGAALRQAAMHAGEDLNRSLRVTWEVEKAVLEIQLQHARLHDAVTHLPNRTFLREQLRSIIATGGAGRRFGLCLLRIDDFDDLNDALGHRLGDEVLEAIGWRLGDLVRAWTGEDRGPHGLWTGSDRCLLAHLGGERFVLVVTGTHGAEDMVKLAEQARQAVHTVALPAVDGYELRVRVSAGIVEGAVTARAEPDDWLRDVHLALIWAQKDHRDWAVHDDARARVDIARHRLVAAMPAALERGEFEPYFQPLVSLGGPRIIGLEALVRWPHPTLGVIGPEEFIGPAEQTGLIRPLGHAVLEKACRLGSLWRSRGHDLLISVNLSPWQLDDPGLVASVADVLRRTGLPAGRLQLEITESAAVDSHRGILGELAEFGIRLALDDFGTGQASLASLSRLPVRMVKLAAPLVADLDQPDNAAAVAIVHRTIELCHDLGCTVTAEGIETERQYARLRDLGCDYGQGFRFGRPVSAASISGLLKGGRLWNGEPPPRG